MISKDDIDVFIPTFNRFENMTSHLLFEDAIIVCPISQFERYQKKYRDLEFRCCPDEIDGNIARKRNWIKKNCKKKYFVMVDDDLKSFKYIEKRKIVYMTPHEVMEMICQGFQMMEDLGTVLWGINLNDDPKCYREYSPFSLLSPILGPFTAQKNVKNIRYDERLSLKEDYDLSLMVLYKYHKVLRFNKYSYDACHIELKGGCSDYRSMVKEMKERKVLLKKWGSNVIRFREGSINPIVHIPLKGI